MIQEIPSSYLMGKSKLDISTLIPNRLDRYDFDSNNYYKNSKGKLIKYYDFKEIKYCFSEELININNRKLELLEKSK